LFNQLLLGVYDSFLSFGGTQFVQRWNPSIVRGANSQNSWILSSTPAATLLCSSSEMGGG
jgi:hypothetical protein